MNNTEKRGAANQNDKPQRFAQQQQTWRDHEAALMLTCLSDKSGPQGDTANANGSAVTSITPKEDEDQASSAASSAVIAAAAKRNVTLCELAANIAAQHGMTLVPTAATFQAIHSSVGMEKDDKKSSATNTGEHSPHGEDQPVPQSSFAKTFPEKLHDMLESEDEDSGEDDARTPPAMSWLPHGRSFVIRNKHKLVTELLPRHQFQKCKKFGSFTRRLYLWGFRKIQQGPDTGAFHHDLFRRGDRVSCLHMKCHRSALASEDHGRGAVEGPDLTRDRKASSNNTPQDAFYPPTRTITASSTNDSSAHPTSFKTGYDDTIDNDDDYDYDDENDDEDYYNRHTQGNSAQHVAIGDGGSAPASKHGESHAKGSPTMTGASDPTPTANDRNSMPTARAASTAVNSISLSSSPYPPAIQALVDQIDMSTLSLHSLLGGTDSSHAMMHLYQAASESSVDRDALTEWLLFHHQKKLFLRTAILSDMVRTLQARKQAEAEVKSPPTQLPKDQGQQQQRRLSPPQEETTPEQQHSKRLSKQPKLQHTSSSEASTQLPQRQSSQRKSNSSERARYHPRKKEPKRSLNGGAAATSNGT